MRVTQSMPEVRTVVPARPGDVLAVLRGGAAPRPVVDLEWSRGLRELLVDAAGIAGGPAAAEPVVLADLGAGENVERAASAPRGHDGAGASPSDGRAAADPLLGALVGTVFRLVVTGVPLREPFLDALHGMAVAPHGARLVAAVRQLPEAARRALAVAVAEQGRWLAQIWPPLDPRWAPTTGEALVMPLAGGRLVVTGRVDLGLGLPPRATASRCFVAVSADRPAPLVWERLWVAAVVETIRSGAPPFQLVVVSTGQRTASSMALDCDAVQWAAARLSDRIEAVVRRGGGAARPNASLAAGPPDVRVVA